MTKLLAALLVFSGMMCGQGSVSVSAGQVGISDTSVVVFTWVASSTGSVPVAVTTGLPANLQGYWLLSVETAPLSPAPTAGYSAIIQDGSGSDITQGLTGALSDTAGQSWEVAASIPPLNGSLTLNLTGNSVAGASGKVYVYLSKVRVNRNSAQTAGTVTHTVGPLTIDQPVFGNGLADIKVGSKTGSTNKVITFAGAGPAVGDCFKADASGNAITYTCPTGSVTSVAMTGDNVIFNTSVTGSPITLNGTLVPSLKTQTANTVLAGPTSGGATTPTFRALVAGDLPGGPTLCPTCLLGSSLGAGVVHAPGASQTMTSSAVVSADLNVTTTTCTNQFVRGISSGAVGTCNSVVNADITNSTIDLTAKVTGALPTANMAAAALVRPCEITYGSRASTATAIPDDDDVPSVCVNANGATLTLSSVKCTSWGGTASMNPIVTGGSGTSILSSALTCGANGTFTTGTLNGTPTQSNGATLDANISAANSSTYIVLQLVRTL